MYNLETIYISLQCLHMTAYRLKFFRVPIYMIFNFALIYFQVHIVLALRILIMPRVGFYLAGALFRNTPIPAVLSVRNIASTISTRRTATVMRQNAALVVYRVEPKGGRTHVRNGGRDSTFGYVRYSISLTSWFARAKHIRVNTERSI
jgi:hypothetical protein